MKAHTKRTRQSVKIGDWIRTERDNIFEVVEIHSLHAAFVRPDTYGPMYMSADGARCLACAVVEIRR